MKIWAVFSLFFLSAAPALSAPRELLDFQVFAKTDLSATNSDYQGTTGAGGHIQLRDFLILGDLVAGNSVDFSRGQVKGSVIAPSLKLSQVSRTASRRDASLPLRFWGTEMELWSARLDRGAATLQAQPATEQIGAKSISGLKVSLKDRLDVVDLDAADLRSRKNLILEGRAAAAVILRIHGSVVDLSDMGFFTMGGLTPEKILYYFPEAVDLRIAFAGGAVDPLSGRSWGIPGSVFAPGATLVFSSALITGQVFVCRLLSFAGQPGGQVNRSSSAVLREIAAPVQRCGPCHPEAPAF